MKLITVNRFPRTGRKKMNVEKNAEKVDPSATPTAALQAVLGGNVFTRHGCTTETWARQLHHKYQLELHPDKIASGDVQFLKTHEPTLRLLYPTLWCESNV